MRANRDAYLTVYGNVYQAVNRTVYQAAAERGPVYGAVNQTMARNVFRAGNEAVFWALAPSEGPPPPGLELYLGSGT